MEVRGWRGEYAEARDAFLAGRPGLFPHGTYAMCETWGAEAAEPHRDAIVARPGPLLDEVKAELEDGCRDADNGRVKVLEEVRAAWREEAADIVAVDELDFEDPSRSSSGPPAGASRNGRVEVQEESPGQSPRSGIGSIAIGTSRQRVRDASSSSATGARTRDAPTHPPEHSRPKGARAARFRPGRRGTASGAGRSAVEWPVFGGVGGLGTASASRAAARAERRSGPRARMGTPALLSEGVPRTEPSPVWSVKVGRRVAGFGGLRGLRGASGRRDPARAERRPGSGARTGTPSLLSSGCTSDGSPGARNGPGARTGTPSLLSQGRTSDGSPGLRRVASLCPRLKNGELCVLVGNL